MKKIMLIVSILGSGFNLLGMRSGQGDSCIKELEELEKCLSSLLPRSSAIEDSLNTLNKQIVAIQPPPPPRNVNNPPPPPEGSIPDINTKIQLLNAQLDGTQNNIGLRTQKRDVENRLRWLKGEPGTTTPADMRAQGNRPAKLSLADMQAQLAAYKNSSRVKADRTLQAEIAVLDKKIEDVLKNIDSALNPQAPGQQRPLGFYGRVKQAVFGSDQLRN